MCFYKPFCFQFRNLTKLEGDWLKLVVLTLDLLTSVALTVTSLSTYTKGSGSDVTSEGIASVVILGGAVTLYACAVIMTNVYAHRQGVLTAIGGLFFYIGDNLPPVITEYGKYLPCDQECVDLVQIAGIIMLGIATVTYIPVLHNWGEPERAPH